MDKSAIVTKFETSLADLIAAYLNEIDDRTLISAIELQIMALRDKAGTFIRVAYLARR